MMGKQSYMLSLVAFGATKPWELHAAWKDPVGLPQTKLPHSQDCLLLFPKTL